MQVHIGYGRSSLCFYTKLLIVCWSNAGTHWLWEIVSMLLHKTTDYMKEAKETTMMEFKTQEELDKHPSPRSVCLSYLYPSIIVSVRPPVYVCLSRLSAWLSGIKLFHMSVHPSTRFQVCLSARLSVRLPWCLLLSYSVNCKENGLRIWGFFYLLT